MNATDLQRAVDQIMIQIPNRRGVVFPGPAPIVSSGLLQPSDFTYLGQITVPPDDTANGIRFAFSLGAMSGQIVGGDIHLYLCGAQAETGWPDPVYELKYNGVGNACTMVQNWWDVTLGQRVGIVQPETDPWPPAGPGIRPTALVLSGSIQHGL